MSGWCEHCQNTGALDCHCGGDLCVCANNGEYPCPYCDGVPEGDDDLDDICLTCQGKGTVNPLTAPKGFFCAGVADCPDCDGSGRAP